MAWILGSIVIIVITFFSSDVIDIPATFSQAKASVKVSAIFPILLSIITLIWTSITFFLSYYLLSLTNPERYKRSWIILWQLFFFNILTYIFITPVYIYVGMTNYEFVMQLFLIHTLIIAFGSSIIIETLNNYRYVLIGIYGSFIWLFVSMIITLITFYYFPEWYSKLISLVLLLPLISFSTTFFKQLFDLWYYKYHKFTNQDQLWDIFYQIELAEKQELIEEEEKNQL